MHVRLDRPSCPVRRRGPATEWLSEERGGYHRIVCRSQTLYLPPAVQAAAPAPPSVSRGLERRCMGSIAPVREVLWGASLSQSEHRWIGWLDYPCGYGIRA